MTQDRSELCRIAARISVSALSAAVGEIDSLTSTVKPTTVETGGGSPVTSADLAASARAGELAGSLLAGFEYLDEEIAEGPDQVAEKIRTTRRVALVDPVDGSLAIAKAARRLAVFGDDATPEDRVDEYAGTLVLWDDGCPIVGAVATARGHVLVSDGAVVQHGRFTPGSGEGRCALSEFHSPGPAGGKRLAALGAIERLPLPVLEATREGYHCQRPGHFAAGFVELLLGNFHMFVSGTEKIWDYSVAIPFVQATDGLVVTDLDGNSIGPPYAGRTSLRIAWQATT